MGSFPGWGKGRPLDAEDRQKIVTLRDVHGMDFPTIAARMGTGKGTAARIYHEEKTGVTRAGKPTKTTPEKMENDHDKSDRQTKTMG